MASGYDVNNSVSNDQLRIDGGPDQTMDGMGIYNATVTYIDGTTGTITATVLQDTAGNLYLMPEVSANADQTVLEANAIRSITLDSLLSTNSWVGGDRVAGTYAVCFTAGTAIRTPQGDRVIDDLRVGDLVLTMDNGPQAIRWIGRKRLGPRTLGANPNLRPILIPKEVLGVERSLLVSLQHGMLVGGDHLVRAKHLAEASRSRVRVAHGRRSVTYIHMMFDAHQIIFSEGAPSESFYPGPMAQRMVDPAGFRELSALFPDMCVPQADRIRVARHYGDTARVFLPKRALRGPWRAFARCVA